MMNLLIKGGTFAHHDDVINFCLAKTMPSMINELIENEKIIKNLKIKLPEILKNFNEI